MITDPDTGVRSFFSERRNRLTVNDVRRGDLVVVKSGRTISVERVEKTNTGIYSGILYGEIDGDRFGSLRVQGFDITEIHRL